MDPMGNCNSWLHNLHSFQGCIRQLHLNRLTLEEQHIGMLWNPTRIKMLWNPTGANFCDFGIPTVQQVNQYKLTVSAVACLFDFSPFLGTLLFHVFIALIICKPQNLGNLKSLNKENTTNNGWLSYKKREPPSYQWSYNFFNPVWAYG